LIPLDSPGLTVRPIATIEGWHNVNEVFLQDVRVPVGNRVGAEGQGWDYGKFILGRERLGAANTANIRRFMQRTRDLVLRELDHPADRSRRDVLLMRLLRIEAEIAATRALGLQAVDKVMSRNSLGVTPSILKLVSSRLYQEISEIALEVLGPTHAAHFAPTEDQDDDPRFGDTIWLQNFLFMRVRTIYGGSNEVQKNVMARTLFPDIR
jgi:alkylation response protein AidB-like acyl-CoA dehydrogenase